MAPDRHAEVSDQTLRFSEDGTFQISVFEDLHFAEDASKDIKSKGVMKYVLEKESPELVVINGDLVSGEFTKVSDSSEYVHDVVSPLVDKGKLWASTYGNHDSNTNLSPKQDVFDQEKKYPNSLTQRKVFAPKAGITNYYLPVYSHKAPESSTPALILWFFDSKGGSYATNRDKDVSPGARGDWIDASVVDWFVEAKKNLSAEYDHTIPSLAFFHIPSHAMLKYQQDGFDASRTPGINGEKVVSQGSMDTDYSGQDLRFMEALLNTTGLMATFSGHDHKNDWCFKWDGHTVDQDLKGNGINMCYGRHTGYGGYGDATRGGRQILLDQETMDDEIKTWIRLEDGSISAPVTLNATYGQDKYAKVNHKRSLETSGASGLHDHSGLLMMICLWLSIWLMFWRR